MADDLISHKTVRALFPGEQPLKKFCIFLAVCLRREAFVEARDLIAYDDTLDPDQVSVVKDTLEEVWLEVEWRYRSEAAREIARTRLAFAMLRLAHHGIFDVDRLRISALDAVARG